MNDLVIKENVNAVDIFTAKGLDSILADITKEVRSVVPDITTSKGRKEIASLAHKVARSKTALDGMGKELVREWKDKAKLVDAERKKSRDYLDALKDEVRSPLDAWEKEEADKLAIEEAKIAQENDHAEAITINDAMIKEADFVERERVIAEKEAVIEREEIIAREAAERAKLQAEQRRLDAAREAKETADLSISQQKQREDDAKYETERRGRNTRHEGAIKSQILEQFMKIGMNEDIAKKVVEEIAKGAINNVNISY